MDRTHRPQKTVGHILYTKLLETETARHVMTGIPAAVLGLPRSSQQDERLVVPYRRVTALCLVESEGRPVVVQKVDLLSVYNSRA